jgi:hypothetical protein
MAEHSRSLEARVAALEAHVSQLTQQIQRSAQDAAAARVLAGGAAHEVDQIRSEIRDFRHATTTSFNALRADMTGPARPCRRRLHRDARRTRRHRDWSATDRRSTHHPDRRPVGALTLFGVSEDARSGRTEGTDGPIELPIACADGLDGKDFDIAATL